MSRVVEYPVRTPPLYWVVVGALAVIGVFAAGVLVYAWVAPGASWPLLLTCAVLAAFPFIHWQSTAAYRVHGVVRLDREGVEVPSATGAPLRLPAKRVHLHVTRMSVRYTMFGLPVARVSRGMVLDLRADAVRRTISTLTLVETDHAEALLADIERVLRGQDPQGPFVTIASGPPRPRDRYEDQLDRELAALD